MDRAALDRLRSGFFRPACPVCGVVEWQLVSDGEGNPRRMQVPPVDGAEMAVPFAVFALACGNCHYVRFMAADPLPRVQDELDAPVERPSSI